MAVPHASGPGTRINGWVDLAKPVQYGAWNDLAIEFTGSSYVYSINGSVAFTDTTVNGSTGVSRVLMQVYNFGDLSITGAVVNAYAADWVNAPEPATLSLLALGFAGLLTIRGGRKLSTDMSAAM